MKGVRYQSRRGWFFLSINGNVYLFHLALGPFSVAWDQSVKVSRKRAGWSS